MTIGSDFSRDISYVAESAFGSTPGAPTMQAARFTGGFPDLTKETFVTEEIRSDGQLTDMRHGKRSVAFDMGFELSYGAYDDFLEMTLGGAWAANVLKAGRTNRSATLEQRHTDLTKYTKVLGATVNTLSLSVTPGQMVTGSFGFMGKDMSISGTSLGVPVAAPAFSPFDAFSGTVLEGGGASSTLTSLELSLTRNIEPVHSVLNSNAATAIEMTMGQNVLTGTAQYLFESETMFDYFANETERSISFTLEGANGGDLTFNIPRIKYTGAPIQRGEGTTLIVSMPFQALLDSATNTNLMITRIPA